MHKIITGRADQFDRLRTRNGLSGYPSRAESEHDWIENSHASTSLSYADGLAKAFALRKERGPHRRRRHRRRRADRRNGLGGAEQHRRGQGPAAGDRAERQRPLLRADHRRDGPADGRDAARPGYERMLGRVKKTLPRAPVVGRPLYSALHAAKSAVKDWFLPQTHVRRSRPEVPRARSTGMTSRRCSWRWSGLGTSAARCWCTASRRRARATCRPNPTTPSRCTRRPPSTPPPASPRPPPTNTWTQVFGREMVVAGAERPDVVAITAAMCGPTGLVPFATAFPDRRLRRRDRRAARDDLGGRAGDGRHAPGGRGLCDLPEPRVRPAADGLRAAPAGRHRGAGPGRRHRRGRAQPSRHVGHVAGRDRARVCGWQRRGTPPPWPRNWPRRCGSPTARRCSGFPKGAVPDGGAGGPSVRSDTC